MRKRERKKEKGYQQLNLNSDDVSGEVVRCYFYILNRGSREEQLLTCDSHVILSALYNLQNASENSSSLDDPS